MDFDSSTFINVLNFLHFWEKSFINCQFIITFILFILN